MKQQVRFIVGILSLVILGVFISDLFIRLLSIYNVLFNLF